MSVGMGGGMGRGRGAIEGREESTGEWGIGVWFK
jgi:hypothetical protein